MVHRIASATCSVPWLLLLSQISPMPGSMLMFFSRQHLFSLTSGLRGVDLVGWSLH